jgi:hypothetical protein
MKHFISSFYLALALTVIFLGLAALVFGIESSSTPSVTSAFALSH